MKITDLPTLNAILNLISSVFLVMGFIRIKQRLQTSHQKYMIGALIASAVFLVSYLIYHYYVGSVPYPYFDWTRPVYYILLVPHIILAAVMVPFIIAAVWFAWRKKFDKHTSITPWLWPVWMYVSVSGILIYIMLYRI
jgi:putative membrane protein